MTRAEAIELVLELASTVAGEYATVRQAGEIQAEAEAALIALGVHLDELPD